MPFAFCKQAANLQLIPLHRKFTASHIFSGTQLLPAGTVLVTEADGTIVETIAGKDAGSDIESFEGILCPGFINTHCHLELSHLKGLIPEHTGLVDFVFKIITQRQAGKGAILQAIEEAEQCMMQNGIVAVGDICNTTDTLEQKRAGNLRYHNFIEATGFVPATAEKRFETALQTLEQFKKEAGSLPQRSTVNPHAPYSVSPQLFELINSFPNNQLLTIHNQETPEENNFFLSGTGDFLRLYQQLGIDISFFSPSKKTSLQTILPYFNKQQSLILVHDVTSNGEDIAAAQLAVLKQQLSNIYYCLCANANLYISKRLPDVTMLVNNNCNMVLGTDSLASNHQLSILEEMKTLQQNFPALSTTQLLQWATYNGAKALQMETLGSFDAGKKPGVVLIENTNDLLLSDDSAAKRVL